MIALALASGVAPSVWAEEGERAIITAYDLLKRQDKPDDDNGVRYSG